MTMRRRTREEMVGRAEARGAALRSERDAAVLEAHGEAVRRFCQSRLGSAADAEDAVQDTFLRYLQRSDEEVRRPEAWLIAVARRACVDVVRKRERLAYEGLEEVGVELVGRRFEDGVLTASLLQEVLGRLRPRDAGLLRDLYVRGWTAEQVASELGVPAGHIRVMAQRARHRAQRELANIGFERAPLGLVPWLRQWPRRVRARVGRLRGRIDVISRLAAEHMGEALSLSAPLFTVCAAVAAGSVAAAAGLQPDSGHRPVATAPVAAHGAPTGASSPGGGSMGGGATGHAGTAGLGPASVGASGSTPVAGNTPAAGTTPGAVGWITGTIAHNQNPQQQDASVTSLTVSPHYQSDHTLFAAGNQIRGCPVGCPILFASYDAGASWTHVPALGFVGGQILLPSAYPRDPVIFAIGPAGLQRSTDRGGTFVTVVPGVSGAAMLPAASAGQETIVLNTVPLTVYSEATGLLSVGPALPPAVTTVDALAYVGPSLLVAAERPNLLAGGRSDGVLSRCDTAQCLAGTVLPGQIVQSLFISPTAAADHTVAAIADGQFLISRDNGATFQADPLPYAARPLAVAFASDYATSGTLLVVGALTSPTPHDILLRTDAGVPFAESPVSGLPSSEGLSSLSIPSGSRVIAGLSLADAAGDFGIRCSVDGGHAWRATCP
jgi:RNA polymerase sigma factor (sigma-70 family)